MGRQQASKRARKHRKEAQFAKLKSDVGHPSHLKNAHAHNKGYRKSVGQ